MPLRCARFGIQAIENRSRSDLRAVQGQTLPSGLPSLVYFSLESWAGTTRPL